MNQRYQVKEPLASGGRGEVLLGWDTHLNREVAIKRVRKEGEGEDGEELDQLVQEARTLSTVQHPNVVTVYDAGSDDEGAFIVMELVKGETLEKIISKGALTEKDFGMLVEQTLDGMLAAHQAGVIHLDLKPQNLMITWLPGGGFQVKILDFGLAVAAKQPVLQQTDKEGAIFGSIFFMAPEQFERGTVDQRTDLYALGCIFYHALTQRYPFGGELAVQVMTSHLHHARVPLEKLRPDLQPFVHEWVEWLISRLPEDRPQSTEVALVTYREKRMPPKAPTVQLVRDDAPAARIAAEKGPAAGAAKLRRDVASKGLESDQGRIQAKRGAAGGGTGRNPAAPRSGPATAAVSRISRYSIPVLALLTVIAGVWFYLNKSKSETRLRRFAELVQAETPIVASDDVRMLLDFARIDDTSPAACLALSRIPGGPEVNGQILNAAKTAKGRIPTVNLLKVVTLREINGGLELGLAKAVDADMEVAKAAWGVIGVLATPSLLPDLLTRCEKLSQDLEPFAEAALTGIIQRSENPDTAAAPVVNAYLSGMGEGRYRALLVRVLGQSGAEGAFEQLARAIKSGTVEVRRAAVAALALWPSSDPLEMLASQFEAEQDAATRVMILRAAVPLVMQPGKMSQEELLAQARRLTTASKDRREKDQAATVMGRVDAPGSVEALAAMAEAEPERAGSLEGLMRRLRETLEKVCAPANGAITLTAVNATVTPGRLQVKDDVITGWSVSGDWATWLVELPKPGRYAIQINQSQADGGPLVYDVYFAGEKLATRSVVTGAPYKPFEIGVVNAPSAGHYRVMLKLRQVAPDAGELKIRDLVLKPE